MFWYNLIMTYEYIAGFFDGEGNISIKHRDGRKPQVVCTTVQKRRAVLDEIQKFLAKRDIRSSVLTRKTGVHALQMGHTDSVSSFLKGIVGSLIVKKDEALTAIKLLDSQSRRYCKATKKQAE